MSFDAARADQLAEAFETYEAEQRATEDAEQKLRPASTRRRPEDFLTPAGAGELARRIKKYWLGCGFEIAVEVVPAGLLQDSRALMGIRSNLVAGLPPQQLREIQGVRV